MHLSTIILQYSPPVLALVVVARAHVAVYKAQPHNLLAVNAQIVLAVKRIALKHFKKIVKTESDKLAPGSKMGECCYEHDRSDKY